MRFEDVNWMDVERYLQQDDRLMMVLGSCEQHGYLSLQTDVRIPLALADAASQHSGVLVAPALNFGVSPYFLAYPGTISLRTSTLLAVVEDMIRSAHAAGFRRILVFNGHGGNEPARHMLYEMLNQLDDLRITWYAWWTSKAVEEVAVKHDLKPAHANWLENFSFTRVSEVPEGEKPGPLPYKGLLSARQEREVMGDGNFGGRYQVSGEIMQEMFNAALKDVMYLLDF